MSMNMSMNMWLTPILGMGSGLLLGLTGAGGGTLAAPLLILILQQNVRAAAPIALIAVFLGSAVGVALGLREGIVRYRAALLLSVMGLAASPLGILLAQTLPSTPLELGFGGVLWYLAWRYLSGQGAHTALHPACEIETTHGRLVWNRRCAVALALMGGLTGFLSGLLGVGGGFILVPSLRRHTNLTLKSITATSLMVLMVVSAGGLLQWMAAGEVAWPIAWPFAAGAMVGMAVGRKLTRHVQENTMRRTFGLLCLVVGGGLVLNSLGS